MLYRSSAVIAPLPDSGRNEPPRVENPDGSPAPGSNGKRLDLDQLILKPENPPISSISCSKKQRNTEGSAKYMRVSSAYYEIRSSISPWMEDEERIQMARGSMANAMISGNRGQLCRIPFEMENVGETEVLTRILATGSVYRRHIQAIMRGPNPYCRNTLNK